MKSRQEYCVCQLKQPLAETLRFDEIPLLLMEDLRQLDFPVSRQISYERTVDEFLLQLASNDALRALRWRKEMVILLNEQGALVLENRRWKLYFTPNRSERRTLNAATDDLYEVYRSLVASQEQGEVCLVSVPQRSLRALVAGTMPFCILDEFCKSEQGGYLEVAQNIVLQGTDYLFSHVPVCRYRALSTVDLSEIENYHTIRGLMDEYVFSYDALEETEAMRPISIAVFGPPGSGKSFGVKQIAQSRARFHISSLNLSQLHTPGAMFRAMHDALTQEPGKIPLIFFDEFDSECGGTPRGWLKYFLAPMQDGQYTLDGKTLSIKAAVFVFAGATASSFREFLPSKDPEMVRDFQSIKGPDFVSRLKGILNIKGPNPTSVSDNRHIIRRAMLLREQMIQNVKSVYDEETGRIEISRSLLRSLLRVSAFRHGARSMEFIIGMSRLAGATRFTPSCLPLDEQLDIHLDVKDFKRKLSFEQVMGDMVEQYAFIAHEKSRESHLRNSKRRGVSPEQRKRMLNDESFAPWEQLKEIYKESYRSQIRYLGERFEDFEAGIGLRPILPGADDTMRDLYGPVLEHLAQMEHERWMRDKLQDGWVYGERDVELKHHDEMVAYSDLSPSVQEFVRSSVRNMPGYLKEIGYELYRKVL